MKKSKKHPFCCENCDAECMIYRSGKKHRVFVCPNCGVLATNGKKKGGIVKKVAKRGARAILGEIPGASAIMEGIGLVSDLKGDKKVKEKPQNIKYDSADKPNYSERVVNKVLYGE